MNSSNLCEIEEKIGLLSQEEQLWLIEQIVRRLREGPSKKHDEREAQLAAMAEDPEIQKELHEIENEFVHTEIDGLEEI